MAWHSVYAPPPDEPHEIVKTIRIPQAVRTTSFVYSASMLYDPRVFDPNEPTPVDLNAHRRRVRWSETAHPSSKGLLYDSARTQARGGASSAGVAEADAPGFARDVTALLNAIASGCLRCEWAVYEANGGALDASLAQEYRDFVRTLPAQRRPQGWENWSDYETLLHVNQPLARPWTSVATRQIRVLLPSDVEQPSNAWPPLDMRAVGRGPPRNAISIDERTDRERRGHAGRRRCVRKGRDRTVRRPVLVCSCRGGRVVQRDDRHARAASSEAARALLLTGHGCAMGRPCAASLRRMSSRFAAKAPRGRTSCAPASRASFRRSVAT